MAEKTQSHHDQTLPKVQRYSWIVLGTMTIACWLVFSLQVAISLLIGGVLVNLSFALLRKDLTALLAGPQQAVKARFFIKYYARFTVLAVILFFLIKHQKVHTMGLLAGLSSVFLSIVITSVSEAKRIFFRAKEAS